MATKRKGKETKEAHKQTTKRKTTNKEEAIDYEFKTYAYTSVTIDQLAQIARIAQIAQIAQSAQIAQVAQVAQFAPTAQTSQITLRKWCATRANAKEQTPKTDRGTQTNEQNAKATIPDHKNFQPARTNSIAAKQEPPSSASTTQLLRHS